MQLRLRAKKYLMDKQWQRAVDTCTEGLNYAPDCYKILRLRALAFTGLSQHDLALGASPAPVLSLWRGRASPAPILSLWRGHPRWNVDAEKRDRDIMVATRETQRPLCSVL